MRINTNVSAMNSFRNLTRTENAVSKSMEKLSSGFRINKASDDAAGLGIANKLRADLRSLKQASNNAEQASAMLQISEGATQTVSQILDRMKELATQASSDNVDDAGRGRIKAEWTQLTTEIGMIAETTKFQGKALVNGGFGNSVNTDATASTALAAGTGLFSASINGAADGDYTFSQDADGKLTATKGTVTETVDVVAGKQTATFSNFGITLELDANFDETTAAGTLDGSVLKVAAGSGGGSFLVRSSGAYTGNDLVSVANINLKTDSSGLNLVGITLSSNGTAAEWQAAMTGVDGAIDKVNAAFGSIGAAQSRIDYATQNVKTTIENYAAAESTIRDVDMAQEMTTFSKNQILQQAGTAMLAQANQLGQGVLQLLRG